MVHRLRSAFSWRHVAAGMHLLTADDSFCLHAMCDTCTLRSHTALQTRGVSWQGWQHEMYGREVRTRTSDTHSRRGVRKMNG
jgi:hypothetical protein